jgi:dTMP kinase
MARETAQDRGRFVVIDGVDGCGKTTQARRLCAALVEAGRPAPLHLREPGSTVLGERLRKILLGEELELGVQVQSLLFTAARRQTLDELVEPALSQGRDVVCERFHPSTFAYQAVAGGDDEEAVLQLLERWAGDPTPDVVILLSIDPEAAAQRRATRAVDEGGTSDRFEAQGLDFQREVQAGMERYAERAPHAGRIVRVDGDRREDEVATSILEEVRRAL